METIDFYIDKVTRQFVNADGTNLSTQYLFVRGDKFIARFTRLLVDRSQNPVAVSAAPFVAGSTFTLSARAKLSQAAVALADNSQFNIDGDWSDTSLSAGKICARVDLGAITADAFGDTPTLQIWFDIEAIAPDATAFTVALWQQTVNDDVTRGDEGSPPPTVPTYFTAVQTAAFFVQQTPANANFQFFEGKTFQLLNPDTGLFHTLKIQIVDGTALIVPDQTGIAAGGGAAPSPGDGANFRFVSGTTFQLLNPDTNLFHTLKIQVVGGVASIVPDQTGEA